MSQALLEKIRKARQVKIVSGDCEFTIRRPTDMEVGEMRGQHLRQGDIMRRFVVDWPGMQEIDLIPGGSPVPVPFDTDLFMEWIADRPQHWAPIVAAVLEAYKAHDEKMKTAAGEPEAG